MEEDIKSQMKNIVLIGPVYPYKGGIAHYTSLLYRALAKEHHVSMISYKMQYPKFLYKKSQKDHNNDSFKIDGTKYWIHTANPFNWIAIVTKIKNLDPNMIIFQWWHPYFAPCYYIMVKLLKKKRILFVCHNVFPHERFPLDRILTEQVLRQGDYYIVHSKADKKDLQTIINNPVCECLVHPTYNTFNFHNLTKIQAREMLGLQKREKVLLFFGFVRKYKGLKYLIKALVIVKNIIPEVKLLIVGDFDHDKEFYMELIHENELADYIQIFDGYIPDQEVEKYFAASDLVVLPYESATQSGIVQIAFGFEKPVVVTEVGGLPDVVADGKTGYVVPPQDAEKIAEAIIDYFEQNKRLEFGENIKQEAGRFSWDRMAESIDKMEKVER